MLGKLIFTIHCGNHYLSVANGSKKLQLYPQVTRLGVVVIFLLSMLSSCVKEDVPVPFNCANSTVDLNLDDIGIASGCDANDGSIKVMATGGSSPYQYALNDQASQTSGNFSGLRAGIYTVKVTDRNTCEAELTNIMVMASGFTVQTEIEPDNVCLGGDGSITILITEGNPPYQYQLEGGDFLETNIFTGLTKGSHKFTVRDDANCSIQLNVTVPHGFTGTSWAGEILPIMETKCSLRGCHDGVFQPDLRMYSQAKFYAPSIKELTRNKSMPLDGSLTQNQIELITCWVDDGALEN